MNFVLSIFTQDTVNGLDNWDRGTLFNIYGNRKLTTASGSIDLLVTTGVGRFGSFMGGRGLGATCSMMSIYNNSLDSQQLGSQQLTGFTTARFTTTHWIHNRSVHNNSLDSQQLTSSKPSQMEGNHSLFTGVLYRRLDARKIHT